MQKYFKKNKDNNFLSNLKNGTLDNSVYELKNPQEKKKYLISQIEICETIEKFLLNVKIWITNLNIYLEIFDNLENSQIYFTNIFNSYLK